MKRSGIFISGLILFCLFFAASGDGTAFSKEISHRGGLSHRLKLAEGFFVDLNLAATDRAQTAEWKGNQFTEWEPGTAWGGALGYRWKSGLRLELEGSTFKNDADRIQAGTNAGVLVPEDDGRGWARVTATMLNLAYDWKYDRQRLAPYVAVGFGTAKVRVDGLSSPGLNAVPPAFGGPIILTADSNTVSCRQFRLGGNYRLNDRFELHGGFRYFQASSITLNFTKYNNIVYPPGPLIRAWEIGIRYVF